MFTHLYSTYTHKQTLKSKVFYLIIYLGLETTSTTLRWAILLMTLYPEIQMRVRQEIHQKIGHEKFPFASDRQELRFTEATLLEIQRFASLVPNSIPRRAMKDINLFGYDIPKNSLIFSNTYAVHRDPKLWPDPEHFNPEAIFTHLNSTTGELEIVNTEYLMAFGVGRRTCLGESLARQELWIFFVGLLQRFQFVADPSNPLPSACTASCDCIIRFPPLYNVIFK